MAQDEVKTVIVRISGRVQGVWFRDWTGKNANQLGLSGWVRNRRDGTVEALFSGPCGEVDDMVRRCRSGPSSAHVAKVEASPCQDAPLQGGFYQRGSS